METAGVPHSPGGRNGARGVGFGVFLASLAFLLAFPPTLNFADESFILLGARRMLHGEVLYRDFVEIVGPVSFALYALAFRLGGVSVTSAKVTAALADALAANLTHGLARRVAGPLESLLAAALFAAGCVPVWHMASPHWLSTTLCLLCAVILLSPRLLDRTALRGFLVGCVLAVTACNQQQRGAALAVWVSIATVLVTWAERREAPPGSGAAGLRPAPSWLTALAWTFVGGASVTGAIFAWLLAQGASTAEIVAGTIGTVFGGYAKTIAQTVPWGDTSLLTIEESRHALRWLPKAIPGILVAEFIALTTRLRRLAPREIATRGSLWLLAVLMSASVLYYPDYIHVAFIGAFSLVVGAGLLARLRMWLAAVDTRMGRLASAGAVAGIVASLAFGRGQLEYARSQAPLVVPTAFGDVALSAEHRDMLVALERLLEPRGGAQRPVFIFNGVTGLSLLTGNPNPTPYSYYYAPYSDAAQQQRMRDAIVARRDALLLADFFFLKPYDPVRILAEQSYKPIGAISLIHVLHEPPQDERPASSSTPE